MTRQTEDKPATVPLAQQAGAIPAEWLWVKPCAWTIRMLTALITGVKGQKWFRLIDKVFAERNLWAAFQQVAEKKGAAGVDRVTVDQFEKQLPDSVWELSDQLRAGAYRPGAVLSPLLSNIYLNPLDHMMAEAGYEMVRYADDFVILCRTGEDAQRALELVRDWTT